MIGAILGDIVGSPYEFDMYNIKTKDFPLFSAHSMITDDSIMTLAVAQALMNGFGDKERSRQELIECMQRLGHQYPDAGYGSRFLGWLYEDHPEPYSSFGNGAAMRVSSVAWLYNTLPEVLDYAALTAEVTHNHPEGIKGAQATAAAIFLARTGATKEEIKHYIETSFGYALNRSCDEIRPTYHHVESCQETVPEAITAFLEGNSFEDVLRTAVSLGGDSDTLAAIAGSIAEGFYDIPQTLRMEAVNRMDDTLRGIFIIYHQFLFEHLQIPEKPQLI
ncbi:MAG: ADP-ribosylglycohydrolase family protein [Oscillospiraceae bacterium]|jgi:ADP-ribosylglycohydrolase